MMLFCGKYGAQKFAGGVIQRNEITNFKIEHSIVLFGGKALPFYLVVHIVTFSQATDAQCGAQQTARANKVRGDLSHWFANKGQWWNRNFLIIPNDVSVFGGHIHYI